MNTIKSSTRIGQVNNVDSSDPNVITLAAGDYPITVDTTLSKKIIFHDGAKYIVSAGVNLHLKEGYEAGDWNHCFDISASGSSVTGEKAPKGYYTPQHFGADPSDNSIDDRPAIEAVTEFATIDPVRDEYANGLPVFFPNPGIGKYYLTKTRPIYIARTTHWYSDVTTWQRAEGGTRIAADDGLDAICLAFAPGGASAPDEYEPRNDPSDPVPGIGKEFGATKSRFFGLTFEPVNSGEVRNGFVHTVTCYLENCTAVGFSEAGFHGHAAASGAITGVFANPAVGPGGGYTYEGNGFVKGNTNLSEYKNCIATGNVPKNELGGAHGFVAHGSVAGAMRYINCDAALNKGAGFLDNTAVGIELFGCHTSQNTYDVSHNSVIYLPIKGHTSSAITEPGLGADWETYWVATTSVSGDSAWATDSYYHPSGGVNIMSFNARASIIGHYTEGGVEKGIIARNSTTVVGGWGAARTLWHPEFRNAHVEGGNQISSPSPKIFDSQKIQGDSTTDYGISIGGKDAYGSGVLFTYGDAEDDPVRKSGALSYAYNSIRKRYELTDKSSASRGIYGITGQDWTDVEFSSVTRSHLWANGIFISDGSSVGNRNVRIRAAVNFAAITDAVYGEAFKGDIWHFTNATAGGYCGAVCITAGTIGVDAVIKQFGLIEP